MSFLVIVAATATPASQSGSDGPPWCMSCPVFGERAGVDIVLNVLLYVPIGAGLALLRRAPGHVGLIAFAIASVIETLQVNVIPGRFASISDVITNTLGALLGMIAIRHWRALLEPTPSRSWILAALAAVLALATLHVTMWAQQEVSLEGSMSTLWRPSPPRARDSVPPANDPTSRIVYVILDGRRHPGRVTLPPNEVAALGGKGEYGLEMGFIPAARPGDEDPAFELQDAEGRRVLRVRQDGRHLAGDVATRGRALHLRTPTVRLRRFLAMRAERLKRGLRDTVHVSVRVAQGNLSMHARLGDTEDQATHRRGAFAGWSLLIPQSNSPARVRILTFVWVVALILPAVYWAVLGMPPPAATRRNGAGRGPTRWRSRPSVAVAAFLVVFLTLALQVLPIANGMEAAGLLEGLAVVAAVAAGSYLALHSARRRDRQPVAMRA